MRKNQGGTLYTLVYGRTITPHVDRLRWAPYLNKSAVAPFDRETLVEMKKKADVSRMARIPAIRKI